MPGRPALVFAGGGHAHLYSLLRTAALTRCGFEVTLVNPGPYLYYSGMATGVVSGLYTPEQDRLNVRRLVEDGGGRFVEGRVEKIYPDARVLLLGNGLRIPYDAASFCVGSEVRVGEGISHVDDGAVIPVKPVSNAADIRDALWRTGVRVVIAGGGVAGCEVAANAAHLAQTTNPTAKLTLVESAPELLADAPKRARRAIFEHLQDKGVELILDSRVVSYGADKVSLDSGRSLTADFLVVATGTTPPPIFSDSGLLAGDAGGLWVNHHLQSPHDPRLFGGGDSVSFRGRGLPGLGVYAIRQGPVLFHNLQAFLKGAPLSSFTPQRRYLYVLNLGDGSGLGIYGRLSWKGRSAMRLKQFVDGRFMREYRR